MCKLCTYPLTGQAILGFGSFLFLLFLILYPKLTCYSMSIFLCFTVKTIWYHGGMMRKRWISLRLKNSMLLSRKTGSESGCVLWEPTVWRTGQWKTWFLPSSGLFWRESSLKQTKWPERSRLLGDTLLFCVNGETWQTPLITCGKGWESKKTSLSFS